MNITQKRFFKTFQKIQDDCSECSSIQAVCLAYAMIKSVGIMNDIPTGSLLKFCEKMFINSRRILNNYSYGNY